MDVVIQDKAFPMYSFPFSIIIREQTWLIVVGVSNH